MIAPSGTQSQAGQVMDLVERLTQRMQAGEPVDIETFLAEHAKHAEEVRRLLPALALLVDLSGSGDQSDAGESVLGRLGDFRILREVGRGGMGVVYEAEQISLNRRVALKVLPFAATMDPRQLQRFHNEARAAASLEHPHIVPVYGVGCDRGVHYYAMKFIDGVTLADVIRAGSPERERRCDASSPTSPVAALSTLPDRRDRDYYRRCAALMADAADAVEFAHSTGVVHRDIKPGNLMLDTAGKLWVTDFGLARVGTDPGLTMSGDLLGTLRYMAPEQALAKHGLVDHRADVYGLGATLYELLTGRPAVGGADKEEVLRRIAFEEPAAPRKLDKTIPAELETVALKCLAKEPDARYSASKALAEDLRRWSQDEPIKARPPKLSERTAKWARRRATLLGAAAVVLLVALLALAVSSTLLWKKDAETQAARDRAQSNLRSAMESLDRVYLRVAERRYPQLATLDAADQDLLREVLDYYQRFARENVADPNAKFELAKAHLRVGELRRKLGISGWKESYDASNALLTELVASFKGQPDYRHTLATLYAADDRLEDAARVWDDLAAEYPTQFEYRKGQVYVRTRVRTVRDLAAGAVEMAERLARDFPAMPAARLHLAEGHNHRGTVHWHANRFQDAERDYRAAQELLERLVTESPADDEYKDTLARNSRDLGQTLGENLNNCREAEPYLRRAIELHERLASANPGAPALAVELGKSWCYLGRLFDIERRPKDVKHAAENAARTLERVRAVDFFDKDPRAMGIVNRRVAKLLLSVGERETAFRLLRQSVELSKRAFQAKPENPFCLCVDLNGASDLFRDAGEHDMAIATRRETVAIADSFISRFGSTKPFSDSCIINQPILQRCLLAELLEAIGRPADSEGTYREALDRARKLLERFPEQTHLLNNTGVVLTRLALSNYVRGEFETSVRLQEECLLLFKRAYESNPGDPNNRHNVAATHNNLACSLIGRACPPQRDFESAIFHAHKAIELASHLHFVHLTLGEALYRSGDCSGAIASIQKGRAIDSKLMTEPSYVLAMAYWRTGDVVRSGLWLLAAEYSFGNTKQPNVRVQYLREEAIGLLTGKKPASAGPTIPTAPP